MYPSSWKKLELRAKVDRMAFGLFGGSDGVGAGLGFGGGTSADPLEWDQADKNWIDYRTKATGTGTSRLAYLRHTISGTGADGETFRAYTFIENDCVGGEHGAHITCQVGTAGNVAGLAAGVRATFAVSAQTKTLAGTVCGLQIDSDIGAGVTVGGIASMIRLAKSGSVDIPFFLDIADDQCLKGSSATGAAADALAVRLPAGTTKYISLIAAS